MYNKKKKECDYMLKFEDQMYIICPPTIKKKLLLELSKEKNLFQITFATLEDVKKHYFFKIKNEAICYLLEQNGENLNNIKTKLSYLHILEDKEYNQKKLNDLNKMKNELKEKGYFIFDPSFKKYVKQKKVLVLGYNILQPYEKKMLEEMNAIMIEEKIEQKKEIVITSYDSLYEEVVALASKIRKLNHQKISYHHIFIVGIDDSYFYQLIKVFNMFDIPITLDKKNSILSTIEGKNYLITKDITKIKNDQIRSKIINIEIELSYAKDSKYYDILLEDALKNTYLEKEDIFDSIHVLKDITDAKNTLAEDDYLFVLGFNQNKIPKIEKDIDYLNDQAKQEIGLYQSYELNKRIKQTVKETIYALHNIFLSYKSVSLQEEFYPSSLIQEMNMLVVKEQEQSYHFSHQYNKYHLARLLDAYEKYHKKDEMLSFLMSHYENDYKTYDHRFERFSLPKKELIMSYSSLDDYALCPFRYYVKHILGLDLYKETFAQKIGNIYHEVLSHIYDPIFDQKKAITNAKEKANLTTKEAFLFERLEEELLFIIETIKKQEETTLLSNALVEKKLQVRLTENICIKGFIDKILYMKKNNKTYYAFMDYKTGNIELNLDYLKSSLHLQLPIYLYLIEESNIFEQSIFSGFFYQTLLKGKKNKEEKDLKLLGYSASEEEILTILDENYEKSNWIKGLSTTKDGNLSTRSKVISTKEVERLKEFMKSKLIAIGTEILTNEYKIAPKIVNHKNISCEYCVFQEICFHDFKDNCYIEKDEMEV